nr:polysaccharide biosynthesis/export family protein [uncultured Desulfobulbus sp.]
MMAGENWSVVKSWVVFCMVLLLGANCVWAGTAVKKTEKKAQPASMMEGYVIGPGDVLSISVWQNPDLTRVVPVLPDGTISFPLLGELMVSDLSVTQLTKKLKDELEPYTPDPQLSVEVQQTRSLVIYVIGKVNRPGNFTYYANIDVLQALAMAGGLNPFADRSDIKIIRTDKEGKKEFTFDYDAVTEDGALGQNIQLKRGDVVIVP